MKLTMKNDYTFQKATGYPDDPEAMSPGDVKEELARWSSVIGSWMEGEHVAPDQVAGLDGFLSALAADEVEYERPLVARQYHVGFEYYDTFEVIAESEEEADTQAKAMFRAMAHNMPQRLNETKGCFKYLEREDGAGTRLIEE